MKSWSVSCFLVLCAVASFTAKADAAHGAHSQCFCCAQKVCQLTVTPATETTDCFEVECEDVCIPPVMFPWECHPKKCGRVRTVRVLTTEERERRICEYKWDVVVICPRCRDGLHAAGCDVAPGVRVIDDSTPTAWMPPHAAGTARAVRTAAPLSFDEELVE